MDHLSNLPSFNAACDELDGCSYRNNTTEPQFYYQGMSVKALNSPFSIYSRQSRAGHNDTHSINPLKQFHVASLTQVVPDSFDELDPTVIPESILDENAPWHSDNEPFDYALFPTLGSYLSNRSCFSEDEPDIREPALANGLNPDNHVTNPPAEPANPQNSRSVDVINPLNLQQATSDNSANLAEIVDDKSSQVEQQKRKKKKRRNNLVAEKKRQRERLRELRKNPAYAERERDRQRERYKNPAYAERERERQRELQRERYKNPDYAERQRQRQREHRKNPAVAERDRERRRERYRNDPVFAECKRIYLNTYNRMKRKLSKEEASKLASAAREEYLQSVHSPED